MRNASFADSEWEPSGPTLTLQDSSVRGPFRFMNPTTALYQIRSNDQPGGKTSDLADLTDAEKQERARVQWNARDYRKGRHVLILPRNSPMGVQMRHASHPRSVLNGIGRMFTLFPYWDISWLVGISFTIGCLIFVVCGLFYWLPIAFPASEFHNESEIAGGVTAFLGATLFQIGAILLFLESYNDRAETKFGGAMEDLFVDRLRVHRSRRHRPEHFEEGTRPAPGSGGDDDPKPHASSEGVDDLKTVQSPSSDEGAKGDEVPNQFAERTWQWRPSWHDVRTHYIYEIGFLASFTMSVGATIFYIAGIMALPGIFENLSKPALEGGYYFTYLFGGVLFALSSCLYILETQPNWYTPQPYKIGWHVGVWNLIGSVGWSLAASLGYCAKEAEWCEYQGQLALTWASAAFAFGSALQWYESLDKYVVHIKD